MLSLSGEMRVREEPLTRGRHLAGLVPPATWALVPSVTGVGGGRRALATTRVYVSSAYVRGRPSKRISVRVALAR